MKIIKQYLNSTDFVELLNENGFKIKIAQFSKIKKKGGVLPSPDITFGKKHPHSGWKEETIKEYIDSLKHIQSEIKKKNFTGVNQLGNWFNL
ncbi:hypothetical protein P8822_00450 [Bacillus sonorensis]|uniref:hypothetical protein n=1 Tax=Bacillus subtilis group TaxID=653685 RepID=UPI001FD6E8A6|nr:MULTISPECIES: hypothetical protein [Bacillus subtilis group]MCJ8223646.1 hypothetical protein [Bacillus paralicheniformis]MEC0526283.1 hypothetical protein [Bacillus sonorensis]